MHIDRYEKWWMGLSIGVLAAFAVAISVAGFALGLQVPSPESRIDPTTVRDKGPFANPGMRLLSPGKYEAYVRAEAKPWKFEPKEMKVPAGSEVTFYVTSADVQHGFDVPGTNVNVMVLPGQVSKVSHKFGKPGDYFYICTEYCGLGHQNMYGKLKVE